MSLLSRSLKPRIFFTIFSFPICHKTGKVTDSSSLLHQPESQSKNDVEQSHNQSAMYIECEGEILLLKAIEILESFIITPSHSFS